MKSNSIKVVTVSQACEMPAQKQFPFPKYMHKKLGVINPTASPPRKPRPQSSTIPPNLKLFSQKIEPQTRELHERVIPEHLQRQPETFAKPPTAAQPSKNVDLPQNIDP